MKILILGAGGMAGHLAAVYFTEQGHEVTGFTRTPLPYCDFILGDASDKEVLKSALTSQPYDAVFNCVGVLNKEVDRHKADGIYINSYLPHFVANCLEPTDTKLIHLSTDCVFSGNLGSYHEDSGKDSDTWYGRTKSIGEILDDRNLTFRTSIIGPDRNEKGIGLFNWFIKQDNLVSGYVSAIWSGVTTLTLAQAVERAVIEDICGLYHLVNNEMINKYDLLQLFNTIIREKPIELHQDQTVRLDKSLINNRTDFSFNVPSYTDMITEMKDWIQTHQDLYPHYSKG